jgi:hypothetical protein
LLSFFICFLWLSSSSIISFTILMFSSNCRNGNYLYYILVDESFFLKLTYFLIYASKASWITKIPGTVGNCISARILTIYRVFFQFFITKCHFLLTAFTNWTDIIHIFIFTNFDLTNHESICSVQHKWNYPRRDRLGATLGIILSGERIGSNFEYRWLVVQSRCSFVIAVLTSWEIRKY